MLKNEATYFDRKDKGYYVFSFTLATDELGTMHILPQTKRNFLKEKMELIILEFTIKGIQAKLDAFLKFKL
jgi:hypothetical protein